MSVIVLKVPHETARLLSELDVPGERVPTSEAHVTVLFLGDNVPVETLAKAMVAAFEVTSRTRPFTVRTSTLTHFQRGDDGYPVICRIESEPLHTLQAKLKKSLEAHGVPFSNKWPEFKPHVTLSYADEVASLFGHNPVETALVESRTGIQPSFSRTIPTVEWGAHELVLWGGDDGGDRRLVITFPFTLDPRQEIARRVAQRFSTEPLTASRL